MRFSNSYIAKRNFYILFVEKRTIKVSEFNKKNRATKVRLTKHQN